MQIGNIDFLDPRQKMWGILKKGTLANLPYGHETNNEGVEITSYSTNCYADALSEVHDLIATGTISSDILVVEFVPYDYIMQPRV